MSTSGNITERRTEIEDLVSEGEHRQGFIRALDFAREFAGSSDFVMEAVTLSGEYHSIEKEFKRSFIPQDQYLQHLRRLTWSLLEMLNRIVDSITRRRST